MRKLHRFSERAPLPRKRSKPQCTEWILHAGSNVHDFVIRLEIKKNFNSKNNKHIISNCQRKYVEFQVSLEIEKAMVVTLNLQGHGLNVFRFKVGV
jgi:hypothetical protein